MDQLWSVNGNLTGPQEQPWIGPPETGWGSPISIPVQEVQATPAPGALVSAGAPTPHTAVASTLPHDLWIWTVSPSEKRSRGPCQLWDAQTQRAGDGPPRGSRAACHAAVSGHGPPPSVYRTRTPDLTKSISLSLHLDMIDQNRALRFLGLPW